MFLNYFSPLEHDARVIEMASGHTPFISPLKGNFLPALRYCADYVTIADDFDSRFDEFLEKQMF